MVWLRDSNNDLDIWNPNQGNGRASYSGTNSCCLLLRVTDDESLGHQLQWQKFPIQGVSNINDINGV